MTPIDRLKETIAILKNIRKGLTNQMISKELGYNSETYVSDIIGGSKRINDSFLKKLKNVYSINGEWIMQGKGEMFVDEAGRGKLVAESAIPYGEAGWSGVPVFDVPIASGIINREITPVDYVKIARFKDCEFGIQASGDEMSPRICNGDYILCKEVHTNEIIIGDVYLILTKKGNEVVRYAQPHKTKSGHILLTSEKQSASSTVLALSAVRKIYKVRGVIRNF